MQRPAYETFVAEAKKISELYADLAKQAYKPLEGLVAKICPRSNNETFGTEDWSPALKAGLLITKPAPLRNAAGMSVSCPNRWCNRPAQLVDS